MNATEEWLRYIENRVIMQQYGITKYQDDKDEKEDDENTKESGSV